MIEPRDLGKNGPSVGCLGYGAMVLEDHHGASNDDHAVATIRRALDAGMTMIDSADAYGNGHNETLIGQTSKGRRDQAFVATKFGIVFDGQEPATDVPTGWGFSLKINGRPGYVRKALENSLRRLSVGAIDLWYAHYADPDTPIKETVGAMAEAVTAGKVRHLGLSNVTAGQVRRAHAVHPIAAVQYEYSLWRREAETALLPALRELGIALAAWSPLGSGFLTGTINSLNKDDFRQNNPRPAGENLARNRTCSRRSSTLQQSWAQLLHNWRWLGSCIRDRTSFQFQAPAKRNGSTRMPAPRESNWTTRSCDVSMNLRPMVWLKARPLCSRLPVQSGPNHARHPACFQPPTPSGAR